ncbi:MAG: radical SAM protein [Chloroflexi bacterium]|nr:radical SAM protein [Chloroflexota bacterium]
MVRRRRPDIAPAARSRPSAESSRRRRSHARDHGAPREGARALYEAEEAERNSSAYNLTLRRSTRMKASASNTHSKHAELVALGKDGHTLPSPVEAYFEVANRCNSRCATCPLTFGPHEPARYLSLEDFVAIAAQLPDLQRAVMHGIGEPLLNCSLPAMLRHLKGRNIHVVFNTNATLLTRKRQIALIESGLDEIRISIDGSSPETYLRVRGIPRFAQVVRNVGQMVRARHEMGATNPRVSFWVTGLRENLSELPGVVELAGRLGVDEVYLQRLTFWGEGLAVAEQSIHRNEQEEVEAIIAAAEQRAAELGIAFNGAGALSPRENLFERPPDAEPWRACSRPLRLAYMTSNGTALPCCIAPFTGVPFQEITLGNYLQDGVAAVWHGEQYDRFRTQLYSSNPPASCRNCGLAWSL